MTAIKCGTAAITYTPIGALSKPPIQSCDYTLRKLRKVDGTFLVELHDNGKRPRHRGRVVDGDAEPILRWLERGKTVMCTVLQAVKAGGRQGTVAWVLGIKGPGVGCGVKLWDDELAQSQAEMERERIRQMEEAMRVIKIEEGIAERGVGAGTIVTVEDAMERMRIKSEPYSDKGELKIEEDTAEQGIVDGTIVKVEDAIRGLTIKKEPDSDEEEL